MNRLLPTLLVRLILMALAMLSSAHAQNLLTNNTGFEANTDYYTPGWGFPQGTPDALSGWLITLDPVGDGYAGAANDQSPLDLEGTNFGYIYSGWGTSGVLETAPGSRAAVQAGNTYTLWFLARGDASGSAASATVSLVWHPNNSNPATVGDPTNLNLTLPIRLSTNDPMQTFHLTAVAPPGAHYASVLVTRPPNDYTPIIVDDFVIMAEASEASLSIKKQGTNVVVTWPRKAGHRPEVNNDPTSSNGWSLVNQPVKGIGATNHVFYPLIGPSRFFRLTTTH
jgi:hypothetical protein